MRTFILKRVKKFAMKTHSKCSVCSCYQRNTTGFYFRFQFVSHKQQNGIFQCKWLLLIPWILLIEILWDFREFSSFGYENTGWNIFRISTKLIYLNLVLFAKETCRYLHSMFYHTFLTLETCFYITAITFLKV